MRQWFPYNTRERLSGSLFTMYAFSPVVVFLTRTLGKGEQAQVGERRETECDIGARSGRKKTLPASLANTIGITTSVLCNSRKENEHRGLFCPPLARTALVAFFRAKSTKRKIVKRSTPGPSVFLTLLVFLVRFTHLPMLGLVQETGNLAPTATISPGAGESRASGGTAAVDGSTTENISDASVFCATNVHVFLRVFSMFGASGRITARELSVDIRLFFETSSTREYALACADLT